MKHRRMTRVRSDAGRARSILAIFAHPDDEVAVGPLLAHYAHRHIPVYVAFVTSGDKGVRAHAKLPAGKRLAAVREGEARSACKEYGIYPPIFLRERDGSLASMRRHTQIVSRLNRIIRRVRPAVIITWGPDGLTGHSDHRAVANLVTEIFQKCNGSSRRPPAKLYYVAYPKSTCARLAPAFRRLFYCVNDTYVTSVISARDGLFGATRALACYASQYTEEDMERIRAMLDKGLKGIHCLRLALPLARRSPRVERDILAGVRTSS